MFSPDSGLSQRKLNDLEESTSPDPDVHDTNLKGGGCAPIVLPEVILMFSNN